MAKTVKYTAKAEKLVGKAVEVFSQAITEVEKAQEILVEGVKADSMRITALNNQITALKGEIAEVEQDKAIKGKQIESNALLLNKLWEFKA